MQLHMFTSYYYFYHILMTKWRVTFGCICNYNDRYGLPDKSGDIRTRFPSYRNTLVTCNEHSDIFITCDHDIHDLKNVYGFMDMIYFESDLNEYCIREMLQGYGAIDELKIMDYGHHLTGCLADTSTLLFSLD